MNTANDERQMTSNVSHMANQAGRKILFIQDRISRSWLGAGIIAVVFLLVVIAVNPIRDFPVEDDWDYAKEVFNFLQTGTFQRLEVTQATVFFPAMWGAFWSKLFGFSFATLRVSTLMLALGALLFFYGLLGELDFDLPRRVIGTLAFMVTPAFVYLAFSFMTDIFLLFGILGALFFYVRAWRSRRWMLAFAASLFAALGFLARQVGILIPVAFAIFLLLERKHARREMIRWMLAGTLVPLIVVAIYLLWSRFGGGANWADSARTLTGTLRFWFQFDTPGIFVQRYAKAASTLGIYLLPLWLAAIAALASTQRAWRAFTRWQKFLIGAITLGSVIALVRAGARGEWFPYLTDILTRAGFRPYLAFFAEGASIHRTEIISTPVAAVLTITAGALGICLSALIVGRLRAHMSPELSMIYLTTAILALASLTFFTYFERYLVPLIPGLIILILDATRRAPFSMPAGALGIFIVAFISIALMRDYFAWNDLRWSVGRALLARGVAVEQLDGGYEWNGWHLYDASVEYIRTHNLEMAIDPWKYLLDPAYMIAFQPAPNYHVVQEFVFATPLRASGTDRIFLLQRETP